MFSVLALTSLLGRTEVRQKPLKLQGTLKDVVQDPIDSLYSFLIVITDEKTTVNIPTFNRTLSQKLEKLIGAQVEIDCMTRPNWQVSRKPRAFSNNELWLNPYENAAKSNTVRIVSSPASSLFDTPNLEELSALPPAQISSQWYHRTSGRVLATWDASQALIRTATNKVVLVEFRNSDLPTVGTSIEAVGLPETDIYHLRLIRAIWRPAQTNLPVREEILPMSGKDFLTTDVNSTGMNIYLFGKTVRVKGIVRSLPNPEANDPLIRLEDQSYSIPVNVSSTPDATKGLEIGCTIEVTGVCVMDIDAWRPNAVFPRIKGFSVVTRTADDIRVLARPPWWTPKKLIIVIGLLVLALVVILIRNRVLKKIAELRVKDRTRLAVELHDALSQTLTSVALELQTTSVLASANRPEASDHLNIASKSLLSCRQELRNCLQDLRSTALDLPDLNEAIRLTLEPHRGAAKVALRFNVPRSVLTDNATHAVLRIIRELTLNAIRHGHADSVRIAGAVDGGILRFSVRDNGGGFDPDSRPGVRQGHFGLQGVQERVRSLGGSLKIESASGKGTRISGTIRIDVPKG